MQRTQPLIAVTSSELREPPPRLRKAESDPAQREMALGMPYLRALEQAGALPVVVPPLGDEALARAADLRCDLAGALRSIGRAAAAAGTHPTALWSEVEITPAERYDLICRRSRRMLRRSAAPTPLRACGRWRPTQARRVSAA